MPSITTFLSKRQNKRETFSNFVTFSKYLMFNRSDKMGRPSILIIDIKDLDKYLCAIFDFFPLTTVGRKKLIL